MMGLRFASPIVFHNFDSCFAFLVDNGTTFDATRLRSVHGLHHPVYDAERK